MAIHMSYAGGFEAKHNFFDVNAITASQGRRPMECRCPECGAEVTYDCLMVTCRCIDEPSAARAVDSTDGFLGRDSV